jgi:hypothetical protein
VDDAVAQVPSDDDIRALDLGALISLRVWLASLVGSEPAKYLTTYEEIQADALALAALITGKVAHEETLPPEPEWVAEVDDWTGDRLDDPEVEYRILQLITQKKTDDEIWDILKTEFTLKDE